MPLPQKLLAAALAAFAAVPAAAGPAGPQSFKGEYTVSYLGLPVARATFSSSYRNDGYSIDGSVSAAGLAQIFDDTKGTLRATGHIDGGGRLQPDAFRADYISGKKASLVDIRFTNGAVSYTKVLPAPKRRNKNWVPLNAGDLAGVMDPIAATVLRAKSLDDVCGRTVKIYDGEMRANLNLAYVSTGRNSATGYDGATVTCRLAFEPVAGYRKGRKALDYLKKHSRIMVTFAPLGRSDIYAPIYATIGTQIGTITVSAGRFEAID